MMKTRNLHQFEDILDAVSNNIATNMDRDQIISSDNIIKDMIEKSLNGEEMITVKKTYLEVSSLPVNLGTRVTSALSYYPSSLEEIVKMMKENLELEKPEMIKTFSFDSNETYESKVYGKGLRSGTKLELMPSFIGKTVSEASSWGGTNGITVSFNYKDEASTIITNQSVPTGTLLNTVSSVVFTVGNNTPTNTTAPTNNEPTTEAKTEIDENVENMLD